jgi:hypothetical protein
LSLPAYAECPVESGGSSSAKQAAVTGQAEVIA